MPEQEIISKDKEIVQYLIVNSDLVMSGSKLSVQTAHAATITTRNVTKMAIPYYIGEKQLSEMPKVVQYYEEWYNKDQKKIVLTATEVELRKLLKDSFNEIVHVIDNGLTEIPPDSLTVVALYPMPKIDAKESGLINKRWRLHKSI